MHTSCVPAKATRRNLQAVGTKTAPTGLCWGTTTWHQMPANNCRSEARNNPWQIHGYPAISMGMRHQSWGL
jgi:hypothetical protein